MSFTARNLFTNRQNECGEITVPIAWFDLQRYGEETGFKSALAVALNPCLRRGWTAWCSRRLLRLYQNSRETETDARGQAPRPVFSIPLPEETTEFLQLLADGAIDFETLPPVVTLQAVVPSRCLLAAGQRPTVTDAMGAIDSPEE